MRYKLIIVFLCVFLSRCSDFEPFEGIKISQYASKVIRFSSQYTSTSWSASQALGEPDTYPKYGDFTTAWASLTEDEKREYLELGFDTLQTVKKIEIYETWNPGAIDSIYLRDASSKKWTVVYSKSIKNLPGTSRIFTIQLIETPYFVDAIRLAINSKEAKGWNEIDAVAITGQRK
ncbi:MAG: hypothetical protein JNL53_08635 [Cyclobacteriaceae bacterium]|nr:hypothetical protein [Cyclobacteriaceae bacterium]